MDIRRHQALGNTYGFVENSPMVKLDPNGDVVGPAVGGGVIVGGVAVTLGIGCLASPSCRDALGKLLAEIAKRIIDCPAGEPPEQPPKCTLIRQFEDPGSDGSDTFFDGYSQPPMKVCQYQCPNVPNIVERRYPPGSLCPELRQANPN